ncbi:hypothetical protein K505DRAFT_384461 [Melanomma pulvis-pyrius CBS 109.77]|uniref:Aminoglycoside phosphotransferase domain-containing protein n=1 Tax=Melanomma pulvis-pyrius CBS 109.77 TaxID=1314802 RepID=A0A6A6XCG6_9PLEO|nr:hypothetical protein K505DRAFT_384461 [Melanomma pulvis-pyrius CBS 109.77]
MIPFIFDPILAVQANLQTARKPYNTFTRDIWCPLLGDFDATSLPSSPTQIQMINRSSQTTSLSSDATLVGSGSVSQSSLGSLPAKSRTSTCSPATTPLTSNAESSELETPPSSVGTTASTKYVMVSAKRIAAIRAQYRRKVEASVEEIGSIRAAWIQNHRAKARKAYRELGAALLRLQHFGLNPTAGKELIIAPRPFKTYVRSLSTTLTTTPKCGDEAGAEKASKGPLLMILAPLQTLRYGCVAPFSMLPVSEEQESTGKTGKELIFAPPPFLLILISGLSIDPLHIAPAFHVVAGEGQISKETKHLSHSPASFSSDRSSPMSVQKASPEVIAVELVDEIFILMRELVTFQERIPAALHDLLSCWFSNRVVPDLVSEIISLMSDEGTKNMTTALNDLLYFRLKSLDHLAPSSDSPPQTIPSSDANDKRKFAVPRPHAKATLPPTPLCSLRGLLSHNTENSVHDFHSVKHREDQYWWNPNTDIPEEAFKLLMVNTLRQKRLVEGMIVIEDVEILHHVAGSFNAITIVRCQNKELVIKVPFSGHGSHWTTERKYMLESEIATMELIFQQTEGKFPVPLVIDYDLGMDNELRAPYIIMEKKAGVPAYEGWYDFQGSNGCGFYEISPDEKVQWRMTFLESLAQHMAELNELRSYEIGMVTFDGNGNFKIGPHVSAEDVNNPTLLTIRQTAISSYSHYHRRLLQKYPDEIRTPEEQILVEIYEEILESWPFCASTTFDPASSAAQGYSEPETFTLQHPDFNLQNILCDPKTGEVTGIIDWDGAGFAPRCVGHTAVPLFLRQYSSVNNDIHISPHQILYYRDMFATAMEKALGPASDAIFTRKSALYSAIHTSLYPNMNLLNGNEQDVIEMMLCAIVPGNEPNDVLYALVDRVDIAGQMVAEGIPKVLDPCRRELWC